MSARKPLGEDALAALAGLARQEADGEAPGASDPDEARARALAAFREASGRRRGAAVVLVWLVAAALAGLVAVALAIAFPVLFAKPLAFTIEDVPAVDDGSPRVAGSYVPAGATARFSDGSVIAFAAGAGGRIVEVGPHGARVLIESGAASFQIAHRPGARWSVEAGPFAIAVIGTAFDASWSVEAQSLEVRLRQGEVSVNGVRLRAGQRLVARAADGAVEIGPIPPPAPTPVPVVRGEAPRAPGATDAQPLPQVDAPAPPPAPAVPPPPSASPPGAALGWPKRVAAGDFLGVLAAAEARGVEATLRRVSLEDLVALADAARYAGRADLARRALLAERARFPGSAEAHAAAFLLGRLADDAGGAPAAAIRWYDDYLAEAPRGAFAADALGRKLAALRRAHDPAARAAASEYLQRYPEGPYAAAARELLSAP